MAVPKFRISSSKRDMRRAHHALKAPQINVCSNCGSTTRTHRVCESCGFYKGKQVIEVKKNYDWSGDESFATE